LDAYWFNNVGYDIMSYWLLPVCIFMGCITWPIAKWVFVTFYCETVEEPDFMKEEVKRPDMYESVDLEV